MYFINLRINNCKYWMWYFKISEKKQHYPQINHIVLLMLDYIIIFKGNAFNTKSSLILIGLMILTIKILPEFSDINKFLKKFKFFWPVYTLCYIWNNRQFEYVRFKWILIFFCVILIIFTSVRMRIRPSRRYGVTVCFNHGSIASIFQLIWAMTLQSVSDDSAAVPLTGQSC